MPNREPRRLLTGLLRLPDCTKRSSATTVREPASLSAKEQQINVNAGLPALVQSVRALEVRVDFRFDGSHVFSLCEAHNAGGCVALAESGIEQPR